jgi:hypothetical protein
MTRSTILGLLALAAACGDEANTITPDAPTVIEPEFLTAPEEITTDTTWTSDKPYVIPRFTKVFVRKGATLTIQPGTEIRGEKGAVLVITRGAKIIAEGTADKPIVFTSNQPAGQRSPGYWGGVLVLGGAPINVNVKSTPSSNEALFEAFSNADGESGKFGGDQPNDNSGVLKYVRIEFGGFNFVADREFNNLTLCGVGAGTTIDFVQVHSGSDDGIELFGGTVNVKHIVSSQNEDDGFDTDNGWNGKAQFVVVQNIAHRPGVVLEASNGYESDNHGTTASYEADPRTRPTISNVTLIGDHSFAEQPHLAQLPQGPRVPRSADRDPADRRQPLDHPLDVLRQRRERDQPAAGAVERRHRRGQLPHDRRCDDLRPCRPAQHVQHQPGPAGRGDEPGRARLEADGQRPGAVRRHRAAQRRLLRHLGDLRRRDRRGRLDGRLDEIPAKLDALHCGAGARELFAAGSVERAERAAYIHPVAGCPWAAGLVE